MLSPSTRSEAGTRIASSPVARRTPRPRWTMRASGPKIRSCMGRAMPSASAAIRVSRVIAGSWPWPAGTIIVAPLQSSVCMLPFATLTRMPGQRSSTAWRPRSVENRVPRAKAAKASSKAGRAGTSRLASSMRPSGIMQATSTLRMRTGVLAGRTSDGTCAGPARSGAGSGTKAGRAALRDGPTGLPKSRWDIPVVVAIVMRSPRVAALGPWT